MNDTYVMLFFGLLKSLVSKWLTSDTNTVRQTLMCALCAKYVSHDLV